jgi:hypothetical protein
MRRQLPMIAVAVSVVSLVASASALAQAGARSVDQTYPVATALCAKAHAGTLPTRLAPKATAVVSTCDTLENGFGPLVVTVEAAQAQYLSVVSTQKGLVTAACVRPVSDHSACVSARTSAKAAILAAHGVERTAVLSFHTSVEANRSAFWTTIQSLRGPAPTA